MSKLVAAIQIGNRTVQGLALRPKGKTFSLAGFASHPVPDDEARDLTPDFRTLARQLKLTGGQPATLCLARRQTVIRSVTLPSTDRTELVQMARFEAERHIPFNAERHSVGFHVMRSKGVEGSDVLLGAVDGPVVQRAVDALTGAGLTADGVTIAAASLVNALQDDQPEGFAKRNQAIVCIGLDALDLVFVSHGRVLYARSAALDLRGALEESIGFRGDGGGSPPDGAKLAMAAHMLDAEKAGEGAGSFQRWFDKLAREIQNSYDFARREMKCPPIEAIALTGEGAALRNLDKLLGQGGALTVEAMNPVGKLEGTAELKLPFHGLEATMLLGAALGRNREGAYAIDLTPEAYYKAAARKSLSRRLILTGCLLVAATAAGGFAWGAVQKERSQRLIDYAAINKRMQPAAVELKAMETKRRIIRAFLDDPNAALKVFKTIVESPVIPASLYLEKISFVKGESVTIDGRAMKVEDISALKTYLDGTGHFQSVATLKQDPGVLEGKGIVTFTLECRLQTGKEGAK